MYEGRLVTTDSEWRYRQHADVLAAWCSKVTITKLRNRFAPVCADIIVQGRISQGHRSAIRIREGGAIVPLDPILFDQAAVQHHQFIRAVAQGYVRILVVDVHATVVRKFSVPAQYQVAARRQHQRPTVVDHVDVGVIVLDGPAINIQVGAGRIVDFKPFAVTIKDGRRVLNNFIDDQFRRRNRAVVRAARCSKVAIAKGRNRFAPVCPHVIVQCGIA